MRVKNFRAIGAGVSGQGIKIDLNQHNLIFLIGKNNCGKSSVLKAYEFFVKSKQKADESDFFHKSIDNPIEIEMTIQAETDEEREHQALRNILDANQTARIRKTWNEIGGGANKECFNPQTGDWQGGGAGGLDTILQNAFPNPVLIEGLSSPQDILAILQALVRETILKAVKGTDTYNEAVEAINKLQSEIEQNTYAGRISTRMNKAIGTVFPNISLAISNRGETDFTKVLSPHTDVEVNEGQKPGLKLGNQGHGVRRQFVLSAVSGLSSQLEEVRKTAKQRREENFVIPEENQEEPPETTKARCLLFEEPELFLHPDAMRSVKDLIYDLADNSEFQIMAATHAPIMVDLSKPHVTLVRITNSEVNGTQVCQVSHNLFNEDERAEMQMLNRFNPYTCEAFFADRVILVEGDTEAVAVRTLMSRLKKEREIEPSDHVCILNCSTKMSIPLFQKVLRHFSIPYFVLHDIDNPTTTNGNVNPAWTLNQRIWDEIEAANNEGVSARRFLFNTEFESAHGYAHDAGSGKPFSAYQQVNGWDLQQTNFPALNYLRCILGEITIEETFSQAYIEQLQAEAALIVT